MIRNPLSTQSHNYSTESDDIAREVPLSLQTRVRSEIQEVIDEFVSSAVKRVEILKNSTVRVHDLRAVLKLGTQVIKRSWKEPNGRLKEVYEIQVSLLH